jgi:lipopolysaccharide transport system ATP-binding protein
MSRAEITKKFDAIVAFSELERFLDTPVKRYSSGMYVRLAFAVAAHLEPEILIVDEVLAVGDAEFQKKCLGRMGEVTKEGRTILFVSHNMAAVGSLCKTGVLLERGRVVSLGTARETVDRYLRHVTGGDNFDVVFSKGAGDGLRMERACVLADGEPAGVLPLGAALGLRVHYHAPTPTRNPRLGFIITASDGTKLLYVDNQYQPSEPLQAPATDGVITCNLGAVPLMPGDYTISLLLGVMSAANSHVEVDVLSFSVTERDIWGSGQFPTTGVSPMWWPTTFSIQPRTSSALEPVNH